MIKSRVLGPNTGPERRAGYQTNIPPTLCELVSGLVHQYNCLNELRWHMIIEMS